MCRNHTRRNNRFNLLLLLVNQLQTVEVTYNIYFYESTSTYMRSDIKRPNVH